MPSRNAPQICSANRVLFSLLSSMIWPLPFDWAADKSSLAKRANDIADELRVQRGLPDHGAVHYGVAIRTRILGARVCWNNPLFFDGSFHDS
jgi:hypothetical protein